MAIPPEFNGDLYLWINQVLTDLNEANTKLANIRTTFTDVPDIKDRLKGYIITTTQQAVDKAIASLQLIHQEVGVLPDSPQLADPIK